MGTKVKGFFKGLKDISNIFDGDEDEEIQIGMPTDVKHISHIGVDGPATESPSWVRTSSLSNKCHNTNILKTSARNHRSTRSEELTRDISDAPKVSRHHHHRSIDNIGFDDPTTKPKHRRHHRIRRPHKKGDMPEFTKRSRQKKPKDDDGSS
ncbi:hypothetical protein R6Q57_007806 [Mikania cordata]